MKTRLLLVAPFILALPLAASSDWPQWRGPSSAGVSPESALPVTWSATENIAWKARLEGLGTSSPIVSSDTVFVTSQIGRSSVAEGDSHPQLARDDGDLAKREAPIGGRRGGANAGESDVWLVVEAFGRADGRRRWMWRERATGPIPAVHEKHNLATPTPVTDGRRIYAWFGNGQIVALDMDGRVAWSRHLGTEHSPFKTQWGHGSSPTLYRDLLLLLCDHLGRRVLLALDAGTGKDRWKADRGEGRVSHSTPLVVAAPGGDELIVNSSDRIDAYDPRTGALLWHEGTSRQTPIPSAVFHDGRIYLSRGYRNSDYMAIRARRPRRRVGDACRMAPPIRRVVCSVRSLLRRSPLHDERRRRGHVRRRTHGRAGLAARLGGVFFASPVAGDGNVYMASETGETYVLRAGPRAAGACAQRRGRAARSRPRRFRADGFFFAATPRSSPWVSNRAPLLELQV